MFCGWFIGAGDLFRHFWVQSYSDFLFDGSMLGSLVKLMSFECRRTKMVLKEGAKQWKLSQVYREVNYDIAETLE